MIPVVELLRVSTETQAAEDRAGLPAQHGVNLRTCAQYDLHVVSTIEIVESGAEVARSPQMARVLELIQSGAARGIVLAEYTRLFRPDRWDHMFVLQVIADHHAQIYLPTGPIDLQTETGHVRATLENLFGSMERRRIRDRMQRGKDEIRRRGGHVQGSITLPFGLTYSREDGWAYTADAERVREIFRIYLDGVRNMEEIGRRVGVPRTSVGYILRNPVYTGWRVYDKKRDQSAAGRFAHGKYRRTTMRAPDEVIRVRLPLTPLVSEADFAQVQLLLSIQSRERRPKVKDPLRYLYRGFVCCDRCELQLYGIIGSSPKRPYYVCKSQNARRRPAGVPACDNVYMESSRLDERLDHVITAGLADPAIITAAVEAYNDAVTAAWRQLMPDGDVITSQIKELERRRVRSIESYIDGVFDRAERDSRLRTIDGEIAALRALVAGGPAKPAILNNEEVCALVSALAKWPQLDREAKRRMLEALKCRFYVHRYEVQGVTFPFGSDGGGPCRTHSSRRRRPPPRE